MQGQKGRKELRYAKTMDKEKKRRKGTETNGNRKGVISYFCWEQNDEETWWQFRPVLSPDASENGLNIGKSGPMSNRIKT